MADLKNTFIQGKMNKDLDERLVPQGQYRDAQNITVETSEGSNVGAAQNSLGNTLADFEDKLISDIAGSSVSPNARCIGAVAYEAGNKIYYFVASDEFDGIYEYDDTTGENRRVLQSMKVTPSTPSKLNFRKEYCITGVNHILGPNGNTFLYWTDDYNPPRRINIGRCISDLNGTSGYAIDDPRIDYDIDVILEPPLYAPHIELVNDESEEANNMEEKFLYFAYRYLYIDNQYSSLSPFSAVAFHPDAYEIEYGAGNNKSMTNTFNSVKVSFETGNEFVEAVQLVVRDTRSINVGIVDTYYKDELQGFAQTGDSATITFRNNKVLAALPTDQVTRLFDNVPLLAKAQDVIGNRLAYGNYVQFRDITECDGDEISIDYTLKIKTPAEEPTVNAPLSTWRSDRDYEFALLYTDEYGRMTTALTCDTNSIYVPASASVNANQIVMTINHQAPCWATHYRIAVKESKGKVYNIFPLLYYVSGMYRYFLINQSDVDKIKVGEYVIFKSDTDGETLSNKKYKILEVDVKASDFLGSNSVTEISGVYFKIKVDQSSEFPSSAVNIVTAETVGVGVFDSNEYGNPVRDRFATVERPIHYGDGDPNVLNINSANSYVSSYIRDTRFTIEVIDQNTFKYTSQVDAAGGWSQPTSMNIGSPVLLYRDSGSTSPSVGVCSIVWGAGYKTPGDRWKVNFRNNSHLQSSGGGNYFGGVGLPNGPYASGDYGGGAIVNKGFTDPVYPGAIITMQVVEDVLNSNQQLLSQQFPPSQAYYENIEEWFVESGAYLQFQQFDINGVNIGSQGISFRRGSSFTQTYVAGAPYDEIIQGGPTDPMYMIMQGFGFSGNDVNRISAKFTISQIDTPLICETEAKSTDAEIYRELMHTYPIDGSGNHLVNWEFSTSEEVLTGQLSGKTRLKLTDKSRPHYFTVNNSVLVDGNVYAVLATRDRYQMVIDRVWTGSVPAGSVILDGSDNQDQSGTFTPAVIEINTPDNSNCDFNAWSWGNGLESDRILDDFNATTLDFSPRAVGIIENYKQIRNDASVCYSGIYNENTQYNRLNEFNLSLANFKYLDREFGSIQKLYARDTDLLVFQENKISRVLYEKNVLADSAGGGQVVSIPEVLGTQVAYPGEYGISKNPESFAQWGNQIFFTDARRGVVLAMSNDQRSAFNDQLYEISSFGMRDYFRDLMKDNPTTQKLGAYDPHNHNYVLANTDQRALPCSLSISRTSLSVPKDNLGYIMFAINTDVAWTMAAVSTGSGTNWVADYPTEGNGSQNVGVTVSANLTASNRSVNFVVTYCDGLTETFTLTQARGKKRTLVPIVFNSVVQ
jgi:hypothetical protein